MVLSPFFKVRQLILAAFLIIGLGPVNHANAQFLRSFLVDLNSRTVTELDPLSGNYSSAKGINDAGQVVGMSSTAEGALHAFITGPDGVGIRDLGTFGGHESYAKTSIMQGG